MKKKLIALTVMLAITSSFSAGCKKEYPPADPNLEAYNKTDYAIDLDTPDQFESISDKNIQKVLRNRAKFFDTALQKNVYLKDITYTNYMTYTTGGFTIKNSPEFSYLPETAESKPVDVSMLLWSEVNMASEASMDVLIVLDNEKILFLRDVGGGVKGFYFNYDDLHDIKTDGTFIVSGAGYEMVCKFSFTGTKPALGAFAEHLNLDLFGLSQQYGITDYYYVNGSTSTKSEYSNYIENVQKKKKDLSWNKFEKNTV